MKDCCAKDKQPPMTQWQGLPVSICATCGMRWAKAGAMWLDLDVFYESGKGPNTEAKAV